MLDVQTIGVLVTAASVSIAAIYYMLTLKTNQKNLSMNLETRQSQFMSQISDEINSLENWKIAWELLGMEWTDWEDFEKKYGSSGNPEAAARRFSLFSKLDNVGWLLKNGVLDPEWVHSQFHMNVTTLWLKFEPQIIQMRKAMRSPTILMGFEYLGRKILEIEKVKAPEALLPTNLKDTNISRSD
jgi:hypothetical protein